MEEYSEETIGQANSSTKGQCPHWAFGTRSHGVRADGQWQDRGLSLPHHHGHDSQGRQDIVAPLNRKTTIIMAPTRELAQLIFVEGQRFTYATGIAPVCIYGGADVRDQLRQIERGCDLLVATPGRLVDLMERGRLGMENVQFLVLDEADRMLDMGCKYILFGTCL